MQHTGINGDNYSGIEWGLRGLDYQHVYEALSFLLCCIVLSQPLAPSKPLSSHGRESVTALCPLALVNGQPTEPQPQCFIHAAQSRFNI